MAIKRVSGAVYRNGVPRLLVWTRAGRWLALHGALSEPRPDRGSETMNRHRTSRSTGGGLAEDVSLRPERPGEGGGGPRGARPFHQGDLEDSLRLGVHPPGPSLQRLRQGRGAGPTRPGKAPLP